METSSEPAQLLTVVETANKLRLSVGHVYSLINAGVLPAIRVSARGLRVDADDLAEYLARWNGGGHDAA